MELPADSVQLFRTVQGYNTYVIFLFKEQVLVVHLVPPESGCFFVSTLAVGDRKRLNEA